MTGASGRPGMGSGAAAPVRYEPTEDDKTMAMLIHLGLIIGAIISLIVWLIKREKSPFIEHHGKQALCFFVATLVAVAVTVPLCFVCVGFALLPVVVVGHIVFPILAGMAANRGEWYVYPVIGKLVR